VLDLDVKLGVDSISSLYGQHVCDDLTGTGTPKNTGQSLHIENFEPEALRSEFGQFWERPGQICRIEITNEYKLGCGLNCRHRKPLSITSSQVPYRFAESRLPS